MTRGPRFVALGGVALALAVAVSLAGVDARARHVDGEALDAFVRRTGSSELALSSTSRWLRHPSLAEPGAACQDTPPCLDTDPAGFALAPPFRSDAYRHATGTPELSVELVQGASSRGAR